MGHFARECPRFKQGRQQVQAPRAPLPSARGGAQGTRGDPQGRDGSQLGRTGGRVVTQSGGKRGRFYAFSE